MNKAKPNKENLKTPLITWFQRFDKVVLTINELDLNPSSAVVEIFFKKMNFRIEKKKEKGKVKKFKFEIDFFSDVYKDVLLNNDGRFMRLVILKKELQYWPRLTREKESFSWINIDSINYINESDDDLIIENTNDDYDYDLNKKNNVMMKFPSSMINTSERTSGNIILMNKSSVANHSTGNINPALNFYKKKIEKEEMNHKEKNELKSYQELVSKLYSNDLD